MPVLDRAVAWWHADKHSASDTEWLDQSGNGHDAQFGSAAGADSNDPQFLEYKGTQWVYPSSPAAGGSLWVQDDTTGPGGKLDMSGDFDLQFRVHFNDFTPTVTSPLLDGYVNTNWSSDVNQIRVVLLTTGYLFVQWWTQDWPGTNSTSATSTALLSTSSHAVLGEPFWVRVTADVDNGVSGHDVKFYTAADGATPGSWTQLGSTVSNGGIVGVRGPTAVQTPRWRMGHYGWAGDLNIIDGGFYQMKVYKGIAGTLTCDVDFTDTAIDEDTTTFTEDANSLTVTFRRDVVNGLEPSVVNRNLFLVTGDDYFEIADHADLNPGTGDFTAVILARRLNDPDGDHYWVAKKEGYGLNYPGWALYQQDDGSVLAQLADGAVSDLDTWNASSNLQHTMILRVNRTTDLLYCGTDASMSDSPADTSTLGDATNTLPLRFGATSDATPNKWTKGSIIAVALFQEALSDADITQLDAELKGNHTGTILSRATAWWHADRFYQKLQGRDLWLDQGAGGHDAQFGSAVGADTNDPMFLPYNGQQGLAKIAQSGGYTNRRIYTDTAPNAKCLTGGLECIVDFASDWEDWSVNGYVYGIGDSAPAGHTPTHSWGLYSTGGMFIYRKTGAGTTSNYISDANLPLANWTNWDRILLRATLDYSTGEANFYYKTPQDTNWTKLGSTITGDTGNCQDNGDNFTLGQATNGDYGGDNFIFYDFKLYDAASGGTLQMHLDFTNPDTLAVGASSYTDLSANGYTITIWRGDDQEPMVIDRNMMYLAGDDYFEVPHHADLEFNDVNHTVAVAIRKISDNPTTTMMWMSKGNDYSQDIGWGLATTVGGSEVGVYTVDDASGTALFDQDGLWLNQPDCYGTLMGYYDTDVNELGTGKDGNPSGSTVSLTRGVAATSGSVMRFGAGTAGAASKFAKGAIIGLALFRERLNDADLMGLHLELMADQTLDMLSEAEAWWHADRYDPATDGQSWPDQSGNSHDAQLGSTSGSDTNDPMFLQYSGLQGLFIPDETTQNKVYIDAPNQNMRCPEGTEIIVDLRAEWTIMDTNQAHIINAGPYDGTGNWQWALWVSSSNYLQYYRRSGAAYRGYTATVPLPAWSDMERKQIRFTFDRVTGNANFYYRNPGAGSWTQLGTQVTGNTGTMDFNQCDLNLGRSPSGLTQTTNMTFYDVKVYDAESGGTLQCHCDFTSQAALVPAASSYTELSANGYTVTIFRGSALEPIVVNRNMWLYDGVDNYHRVPDHDDLDIDFTGTPGVGSDRDFSANVVMRKIADQQLNDGVMAKNNNYSNDKGWGLSMGANEVSITTLGTGSTAYFDTFGSAPVGDMSLGMTVNIDALENMCYQDALPSNSPATIAHADYSNTDPVAFGCSIEAGTAKHFWEGAIIGAAIVRRTLTPTEMAALDVQLRSNLVIQNDVEVTPAADSVVYTGVVPTIQLTNHITVSPAADSVAYTGITPTIDNPVEVAPAADSVAYTGLTPTIDNPVEVSPSADNVVYTGLTPTVIVQEDKEIFPAADTVTYTGLVPVVDVTLDLLIPAGSVVYTGLTPTVELGPFVAYPAADALTYTGLVPEIINAPLLELDELEFDVYIAKTMNWDTYVEQTREFDVER